MINFKSWERLLKSEITDDVLNNFNEIKKNQYSSYLFYKIAEFNFYHNSQEIWNIISSKQKNDGSLAFDLYDTYEVIRIIEENKINCKFDVDRAKNYISNKIEECDFFDDWNGNYMALRLYRNHFTCRNMDIYIKNIFKLFANDKYLIYCNSFIDKTKINFKSIYSILMYFIEIAKNDINIFSKFSKNVYKNIKAIQNYDYSFGGEKGFLTLYGLHCLIILYHINPKLENIIDLIKNVINFSSNKLQNKKNSINDKILY